MAQLILSNLSSKYTIVDNRFCFLVTFPMIFLYFSVPALLAHLMHFQPLGAITDIKIIRECVQYVLWLCQHFYHF